MKKVKVKNNLYYNFSYGLKECYIKTVALHPETREIWLSPDYNNYYIGQVTELPDPEAAGYKKVPAAWNIEKLIEIAGFLAPAERMCKYILTHLENGEDVEKLLQELRSKDAKEILEAAIAASRDGDLQQFADTIREIRDRRAQRILDL